MERRGGGLGMLLLGGIMVGFSFSLFSLRCLLVLFLLLFFPPVTVLIQGQSCTSPPIPDCVDYGGK